MNNFYRETNRLVLRSPIEGDAEILAAKRSTEFVMRYNLYLPCDAKQILDEMEMFEHIILVNKKENLIIGCLSIKNDYLRYRVDSKSLQGWLTEDMAYQGYMAEALEVVLAYLLIDKQYERVSVQVFADNRASIKLAEKMGFEREGYLKRAVKNHHGQVSDVVLFSIDQDMYNDNISKVSNTTKLKG